MTAKSMTNHSKIRRLLAVIIIADKVTTDKGININEYNKS